MKTERVFLMELFLDDKLPKEIKVKIKDRFQELEEAPARAEQWNLNRPAQNHVTALGNDISPGVATQSPSMQRLMAQNPDLIPKPPVPTTPAAAQALAQRAELMNSAPDLEFHMLYSDLSASVIQCEWAYSRHGEDEKVRGTMMKEDYPFAVRLKGEYAVVH